MFSRFPKIFASLSSTGIHHFYSGTQGAVIIQKQNNKTLKSLLLSTEYVKNGKLFDNLCLG